MERRESSNDTDTYDITDDIIDDSTEDSSDAE